MIDKELIKSILLSHQQRKFHNIIQRDIKIVDINKIYAIIGPRRSGKTFFLFQIMDDLREKNLADRIFYINFEDERLADIETEDLQRIVDAYFELYPENLQKKKYFMFDEIQNAPNWQKFVRRLYDEGNCKIYITGSSAKLLSKEIATALRGRTFNYEICPFSFREFLLAHDMKLRKNIAYSDKKYKIKEKFNVYLHQGGFPEIVHLEPELKYKIIQSYVDLVMFKDVVERYNISRPDILLNLVRNLINNIGREFSVHSYFKFLKSQSIKISKDYLYALMECLSDTYYFFFIEKYSPTIKARIITPKKIYLIDNGIFTYMSKTLTRDLGWLYENLVFITLKKRGYDVYYYKNKYECDFIGIKAREEILPIQVSIDVRNERERRGLIEAMKKLNVMRGYIINEDIASEEEIEGKVIKYVPLWKWILDA